MSTEARTALRCDRATSRDCLRTFEAVAGIKATRRLARTVGWVHRRDDLVADVCPACELAR